MRVAPWLPALLLLAACAPRPETPEQAAARLQAETDSARAAIDANNARLMRYVAAGQLDSVASVYAEDAVLFPVGAPAVHGRAAILALWQSLFGAGSGKMTITTAKVEASGPLAIETGRNIVSYTPGPKAPAGANVAFTDTIKYVTTWRRMDGHWYISNDIGTSDRPAQPAKRR